MIKKLAFLLLLFAATVSAQDDIINDRIHAITNNGVTFYNMDGYQMTSEVLFTQFNDKNLKKAYRKYGIKEKESKTKDDSLGFTNYYVARETKISEHLKQYDAQYFTANKDNWIQVLSFVSFNKYDREFTRDLARIIYNGEVPAANFASVVIDSIQFAGRKIKLGKACYWTNVNCVQCPYKGEMNWSIHKDLDDAKQTIANQLALTKAKKGGNVISEADVAITFEDVPVPAKKVVYDFTGITSVLASMSGGKALTIYYVAATVRNHHVSCVASFWNNDDITATGLPPLLNQVIRLN
jgi:hypothetical protein